MAVALVTGSSGLIGAETARFFHGKGFEVIGIDNNFRKYFFGDDGSVEHQTSKLQADLPRFTHYDADIRDQDAIGKIFKKYGSNISVVIHTAAQPSHDWAAKEPFTDFTVNANGTLCLLENSRLHSPNAVFIFTSTNKVYGDLPNQLPLIENETRWECDPNHPFAKHGLDESMSIDQSKHSLFGSSKLAADVLTQEYGRYFGMKTSVFRGGCLTGPGHSGAPLHGFLSYLVKCTVSGQPYTVIGYKGKQVRDNIHSLDLVQAFWEVFQNPRVGSVYNIGGSRNANCSMLEAINLTEELAGRKLNWKLSDTARSGDHIWWISDVRKFQRDYPNWSYRYDLRETLSEIVEETRKRIKP